MQRVFTVAWVKDIVDALEVGSLKYDKRKTDGCDNPDDIFVRVGDELDDRLKGQLSRTGLLYTDMGHPCFVISGLVKGSQLKDNPGGVTIGPILKVDIIYFQFTYQNITDRYEEVAGNLIRQYYG